MNGVVVIGEGEKDKAPMLFNGRRSAAATGPQVDVAVDPLEGTRLTANGAPNAIAVIAVAERGTMFFPGAAVYMDKIAVGPEAADVIDIDAPPAENVRRVAKAKGDARGGRQRRRPRPRPARELIRELREVGREGAADHGRRRRPLDRRRAAGHRRRPADGRRRHAGGRDLGRGDQVPRRRDPGQALAAHRRGAAGARRRRLRPRPRADHGRPRRAATTSSSRRPASPTAR